MDLTDMISRRRSVRKYLTKPVGDGMLADLEAFLSRLTVLIPGAMTEVRIIRTSDVHFLQKWDTPHALAFFAEENSEDALLNAGFAYQQADLYLQSRGLGSCWVGLGKLKDASMICAGMRLVAVMPFGWPDGVPLRTGPADFRRKTIAEISDVPDARLEPARLAPSATNSQPWSFTHDGEDVHVWRVKYGAVKQHTVGKWGPVDVGIALAHLSLTEPGFAFRREGVPPQREGFLYVGTVKL